MNPGEEARYKGFTTKTPRAQRFTKKNNNLMPKEKAFEPQQMVSLCTLTPFVPWRLTLYLTFCRKLLRWFFCLVLLASALGLLTGCETKAPAPPQEALVVQVVDGDTLVLAGSGQQVRLLGIDAPEMGKAGKPPEFMAHESTAFLAETAQGKKLRLEYDQLRYDHYGRLLAYMFLPSGVMVNAELVRRGLAHVYCIPPNFHYRETLLAAQREALEARRGVWRQKLKQDESYYLANRNSWILHRPTCPLGQKTAPANRVRLTSLKDAYLQGFSPCRSCKP